MKVSGDELGKNKLKELEGKISELEKVILIYQNNEKKIARLSLLKEKLLVPAELEKKLKLITDGVVEIFDADFARVWVVKEGDICDEGCIHAETTEGPHACRDHSSCLHLLASSGRYTHIDGGHRRVPMGSYKIGRVAAGLEPKFITNEVIIDPRVHDHEWAQKLGLVSFAGFRLISNEGKPIGVLAFFSKKIITSDVELLIEDLANTTSQVIQSTMAENALQESEERFRVAAHSTSDLIWEMDILKGELAWFGDIDQVLGYKEGEFPRTIEALEDVIHPDDYDRVMESLEEHLTNKKPYFEKYRVVKKDNTVLYWSDSGNAYWDDEGRAYRMVGAVSDITQLKKAEEKLKEHMDNLEITVKKRTTELTNANVILKAEIIERKKSEEKYRDIVEKFLKVYNETLQEMNKPYAVKKGEEKYRDIVEKFLKVSNEIIQVMNKP